jgi:class 3 adenylate cyclase
MKHKIEKENSIAVFDIRHFSEHRYQLGRVTGGGRLLTNLVIDLLNDAVEIIKSRDLGFSSTNGRPHFLNHTGDGFILVIRGKRSPLLLLLWMSEFRVRANFRIKNYHGEMKLRFPRVEKRLPKLGFGIGAHYGPVVDIDFENFTGQSVGVLGNSINVASRVEQTTKEHPYRVIITKFLFDNAMEVMSPPGQSLFRRFCIDLDKHYLRGIDGSRQLYAFKPTFHMAWKRKGGSPQY